MSSFGGRGATTIQPGSSHAVAQDCRSYSDCGIQDGATAARWIYSGGGTHASGFRAAIVAGAFKFLSRAIGREVQLQPPAFEPPVSPAFRLFRGRTPNGDAPCESSFSVAGPEHQSHQRG